MGRHIICMASCDETLVLKSGAVWFIARYDTLPYHQPLLQDESVEYVPKASSVYIYCCMLLDDSDN